MHVVSVAQQKTGGNCIFVLAVSITTTAMLNVKLATGHIINHSATTLRGLRQLTLTQHSIIVCLSVYIPSTTKRIHHYLPVFNPRIITPPSVLIKKFLSSV